MNVNWKLLGIPAAVCFALSFLVGLIAGVPILFVLLRALVFGVLGGAAVWGVSLLIAQFLPELLEEPEASEEIERGRNVDITVTDEAVPKPESILASPNVAETGPVGQSIPGPEGEVLARGPSSVATEDSPGPQGQGGAAGSGLPGATLGQTVARDAEGVDFAEELEELKSDPIVTRAAEDNASMYKPIQAPDALDEVDVLPDLEGFSSAFAALPVSDSGGSGASSGPAPLGLAGAGSSPSGGSAKKTGKAGDDPELIAQAVRTLLAREQKG